MSEPETNPETILEEAQRIVTGPRRQRYSDPLELHDMIGRMWAAILRVDEIKAEEVALCMAAVKIAREVQRPHRDNLVDMAGYAAVVDWIHQLRRER